MAGSSFRFELAPVLQLRNRSVEIAQEALGRAIQTRKLQEAQVRDATTALDACLHADDRAPRTVHQLGGAAAHREVLARILSDAIQVLQFSRTAEAKAQRDLGQAMREREALETLRSEAADAHHARALRSETARLDDLVTSRSRSEHRMHASSSQI